MPARRWCLIQAGCGTVGYHCGTRLAGSSLATSLEGVITIDRARISNNNAVSCPEYAGHVDEPKSRCLAGILGARAGVRVAAHVEDIEDADWPALVSPGGAVESESECLTVVIIGLDDWSARLSVIERLRQLAGAAATRLLPIQVGLDRGRAVVWVFDAYDWAAPCPACGMDRLPEPEPCILFDREHHLVRGDLRSEAAAAADLVCQIVGETLGGRTEPGWVGTKTELHAEAAGGPYRRTTRRRRTMAPHCLGPHDPRGPVSWSHLVEG